MTISGIEDEFNRSARKPRLVYVKKAPEGREPRLKQLLQRIRDEGTLCYHSFSTSEELADLVQNDVMQLLSERFGLETQHRRRHSSPPAYLQILQAEMEDHGIVRRENLIREIQERLATDRILLVTGDPGIGKTYLLGALEVELDAIYISLRNKTTQQVCSYFANHLSVRRNQFPQNLPSEDEARAALQEELANSSAVLLIDDADQNPIVSQALIGLEFFSCRAIFATRSPQEDLYQGMAEFHIPPFDHDEVDRLLELQKIKLPPGHLQRLYAASQGNPLYLYYFTQYQISPLPEGLEEYQRALWQQLSPQQQELMNLIAHGFALLNVSDLHALLNARQVVSATVMETKHLLDSAAPLIRQVEGCYEFFHPYFEEYVCSVATADGLSSHYHQTLGEYALDQQWVVSAAFHLLHANDPRMREYLVDGANAAMLHGDWLLAEEFLLHEIKFVEENGDKHVEAYARNLLAQVYREMGRHKDARHEVDTSIELFEEAGDEEWKEMVKLWSSLLLIEEGKAEETIDTLRKALDFYRGRDAFKEAIIQLDLGYAYLQVSRFQDGAEAAQHALDLFTELGDERGIHSSLINLAGCVGQLGERDLQRKYAEQIIEIASEHNLPRLKAAGLNHLAIVQRCDDDPIAAQRTLEECITICQQLGSVETEILNIANLGNAFLDQKLYDQAESAYTESLVKARELQLPRHEARAFELLARLKYHRSFHKDAIKLGTEALALHQEFGDHLRVASTQDYLARSYAKLGYKQDAAESYENSGEHYEIAGLCDDAAYRYQQAAGLWNILEQPDRAFHCVSQGVRCALLGDEPDRAASILANVSPDEHIEQVGEFYFRTLELFLKQPTSASFTSFMCNFSIYCKRHHDPAEINLFKSGLEFLVDALTEDPPVNLLNALAVGVEQASSIVFPASDLDSLAERIAYAIDHLYYRSLPDGVRGWTLGLGWQQPIIIQIVCLSEDAIAQRVAMALALILFANRDRIEETVFEFGGNREEGFSLQVMTQRDFEENLEMELPPVRHDEPLPATITESNVPWGQPQPLTALILHDDYKTVGDWAEHPGNKAFAWVLMNVHTALVGHCVHRHRKSIPDLARKSREFCEAVYV